MRGTTYLFLFFISFSMISAMDTSSYRASLMQAGQYHVALPYVREVVHSSEVLERPEQLEFEENDLLACDLSDGRRKKLILFKGEPTINQPDECPICLDDFTDLRRLKCQHPFCDLCIKEWLENNNTCPSCRMDVVESEGSLFVGANDQCGCLDGLSIFEQCCMCAVGGCASGPPLYWCTVTLKSMLCCLLSL